MSTYKMNEYFIHVDGQPVMVIVEDPLGETEVRDLIHEVPLYSVDSFDDETSRVIEYFDGISVASFSRKGSRLEVALRLATERKETLTK